MLQKTFVPVLASATLALAFLPAAPPGGKDDIKSLIDGRAEPLVRDNKGTCLVVGVLTKQGRHIYPYGSFTLAGDQQPDGRTVFEIGSITKVFTALLLALFDQDAVIRLEDPAQRYLPDGVRMPKTGDREITLLHLATHTSGLPRIPSNLNAAIARDPDNPYAHYSEKELYAAVSSLEPKRAAGEKFDYSNFGMGLLGHLLVRKAAAKSYEDLVVRRVCNPLGLNDTRVTLSEEQQRRFAPGYKGSGKPTPHWTFQTLEGAGALRSTADDMLTFLEANVGLRKTKLSAVLKMCQADRPIPGGELKLPLGWAGMKLGERQSLWHNGGTFGAHSFIGFVRETQTAVVVLSNGGYFDSAADRLGFEALKALNGERE
jgi:serine-type D-Ala-D-Ala carboxypeptidase/endopeptidase